MNGTWSALIHNFIVEEIFSPWPAGHTNILILEMISSELRTLFVDSVHTRKNNNGSYTLPLFEQIGIQVGSVAYVDDITLAGQYSAVNLTNNRLFVVEVSPGDARFTENGGAAVIATDWDDKTVGIAFLTTPVQIEGTSLKDFT